jgi:YaiO family outer membrane protein
MNAARFALLLLGAAVTGVTVAADVSEPVSVSLTATHERLDNNSPAWREQTLSIRKQYAKRHDAGIELADVERFGLKDTRLSADYTLPASEKLTLTFGGGISPTHHVLARNTASAAAQYEFTHGWLLLAGTRSDGYDDVRVNQGQLGVENYVGDFSWSASWRPTHAFGTTVHGGELRGNYYYADGSAIGLIAAAGQEASNAGTSIVLAHVRSIALIGHHRFSDRWLVNYGISRTRQDVLYNRNGVTLGVQYAF